MARKITAIAILVLFVAGIVPAFAAGNGCGGTACKMVGNTDAKTTTKVACPVNGKPCPTNGKCPCTGKACPKDGKCPCTGKACLKDGKCPCDAKCCKATDKQACKCPNAGNGKTCKCCAAMKAAKKTVSAICPVMGTKIPNVTKASGKSVYKGKTYYFCCAGCKPAFDKNPEKYIKKK